MADLCTVGFFHVCREIREAVMARLELKALPPALARLFVWGAVAWSAGAGTVQAAEYTLMPSPQTVNIGNFNAATRPALTIESGDTVVIETAAAMEPAEIDQSAVVAPGAVPQYVRDIYRDVKDRGPGPHVLTGPVFVTGAMPGDVLEVRILAIDLAVDYGYNRQRPYNGALPDEFPGFFQRIIPINRQAGTAEIAPGVVVALTRPFFGTMGVAPLPAMGRISSAPPGVHTGNIDNKDVAVGATLYMPVYAPGALFSVGDGHGAQIALGAEMMERVGRLLAEYAEFQRGRPDLPRLDHAQLPSGRPAAITGPASAFCMK
jgi:Acetamidase/Formamidase family